MMKSDLGKVLSLISTYKEIDTDHLRSGLIASYGFNRPKAHRWLLKIINEGFVKITGISSLGFFKFQLSKAGKICLKILQNSNV